MNAVAPVSVTFGGVLASRASDGSVCIEEDRDDRMESEAVWAPSIGFLRTVLDMLDRACQIADLEPPTDG